MTFAALRHRLPPHRPPQHRATRRSAAFGAALAMLLSWGGAMAATVPWADGCQPYIPAAEAYHGLPAGLLRAIAMAESGQNGEPYPWSLNIAGQPVRTGSYAEAALLLRDAAGRPRRDVAIGCMQIHMLYHLGEFTDPEWALHPRYNVWYAALFLARLHRRHGNWPAAIAHYHASDPSAGADYLCRVGGYLNGSAPATARELGLAACGPGIAGGRPAAPAIAAPRAVLMARRQVGRIIVLGGTE